MNLFHATGLLRSPLKISEYQIFCDVFRRYRKRPGALDFSDFFNQFRTSNLVKTLFLRKIFIGSIFAQMAKIGLEIGFLSLFSVTLHTYPHLLVHNSL